MSEALLKEAIKRYRSKLYHVKKFKSPVKAIHTDGGYLLTNVQGGWELPLGSDACPLCGAYLGDSCYNNGCPIAVSAGVDDCEGTPYNDIVDFIHCFKDRMNPEKLAKLISKELYFLQKVLKDLQNKNKSTGPSC
jgi:hypothetical protein